MDELPELTLAFLQRQPASAARTLESLDPEDAAELLRHVPVRIGAPVISAMTSIAAARCTAHLPVDLNAAICEALAWPDASALLRQLDPHRRDVILQSLPTSTGRRFRRSLEYPENTVGAWVELDAVAVVEDRTVSEAVRILAQQGEFAASHLLLTNEAQLYTGVIALAALLRASPTAGLHTLASRDCRPVRDTATLASIARSADWDSTTLLPVVNHRGELLGGLSRTTLSRALRAEIHAVSESRPSLIGFMLDACLAAGEGLLRLLFHGAREAGDRKAGGSA